jgi:hypothetical protein
MSTVFLASADQALFGNQWLALLFIAGLITAFLIAVAMFGRWLAASHPDEQVAAPAAQPLTTAAQPLSDINAITPELFAVIAAAVSVTVGRNARVKAIEPIRPPSIEALMSHWSIEGRRQIYSSHKVR